MKTLLKILKSFSLILIAFVILCVLLPFSVLIEIILSIILTRGESLIKYFKDVAISIDQTGNAICKTLFDSTLITKCAYNKFGNVDETVSSVLGKNKRDNSLTLVGRILANILDFIDENHVLKSIEEQEVQRTLK